MRLGDKTKIKWLISAAAATAGVYLGFKYFLPLILPFLFAYFLAWIVRPVTEFLFRKLKIPRIAGGTISITILSALIGVGTFYLIKTLIRQIAEFIKNLPIYLEFLADKLDHTCSHCDELFGFSGGTIRGFVDDHMVQTIDRFRTNVMPNITQQTLSFIIKFIGAIGVILIVLIAAVLIVKDLPDFKEKYRNNEIYLDIHKVTQKLADAGMAYLRSQLIIMVIVAVFCVLGLTLLKNDYALLAGIGIAFMDALPVLGSGIVFIPWSIIMLFGGDIYSAAILITTFLVCQIIREVLEPRLIGKRIGIKPLYTLIAMYIGVKLFAIPGFILGPIGLIIIITIVKAVTEKPDSFGENKMSYED